MSTKANIKYVGMDVHQSSISIAVLDADGKLVMQSVIPTKATAVVQFIGGLCGTVHVTFEEGSYSAWLYALLLPRVAKAIVCNPRKNALLKSGNKSDKIDAFKLADLLRMDRLSPVYHADHGLHVLKELSRTYSTLTQDTTRLMNRLKALYRSQTIPNKGKTLFTRRRRTEWLDRLPSNSGLRTHAERLFEALDALQKVRRQAQIDLLAESRKQAADEILRSIPFFGPIRPALLIACVQTPYRFRTKRQFWAYCGLALETRSSADYRFVEGELQRRKKNVLIRGLNFEHNHQMKHILKATATAASARPGPFHDFYQGLLQKGIKPDMARLTLARKIAAIALILWKKGERFDPKYLTPQAA
jgi:transposase